MLIRDYLFDLEQHFELLKIIGYGGMGLCYSVRNLQDAKLYALKILHPDLQDNDFAQQQLKQEAQIEQRFQNHPQIIQTYQFLEFKNLGVKVMELLQGMTLKKYVLQEKTNKSHIAEKVFTKISQALAEIHAQGISHGDIKASNIFIESNGNIKLFDFGIAKAGQQDHTQDLQNLKKLIAELIMPAK